MKKLLILLALLPSVTLAAGIGEYSNGWRMGQLTKFSIKGFMTKSGEGQLLMGSESTPYIITSTDSEGNTVTTTINPWYFSSSNNTLWNQLQQNVGEYINIRYKQSHIKNVFAVDTDYEVMEILPIQEPLTESCQAKRYTAGNKSLGVRVGRIVKASSKGTFINSYEIIVQQGNSGNQFKNMSISKDDELFECAVKFLKAGQKVKVYYDQSFFNLEITDRETEYDIVKIEPVKGLN